MSDRSKLPPLYTYELYREEKRWFEDEPRQTWIVKRIVSSLFQLTCSREEIQQVVEAMNDAHEFGINCERAHQYLSTPESQESMARLRKQFRQDREEREALERAVGEGQPSERTEENS